jgi:hypothetical protein
MTGGNDFNICIWRFSGMYWELDSKLLGEEASARFEYFFCN